MRKYVWYADDEIIITFNRKPSRPEIRYPEPTDTDIERKDKKKYPLYNRKGFLATVVYKGISYVIPIEAGFKNDGATIIKIFWTILGESNTSPEVVIGALIHDILCIKPYLVAKNRKLSTKIFVSLCKTGGIPTWKANLMGFCVNIWQFIIGDWNDSIKNLIHKITKR